MPDPITPDPAQVKELSADVETLNLKFIGTQDQAKKALDYVNSFGSGSKLAIENVIGSISDLTGGFDKLPDIVGKAFDGAATQILDKGKYFLNNRIFEGFANDATNQFGTITKSADIMFNLLKQMGAENIPGGAKALAAAEALKNTATQGQQAEAAYYGMLAASGQLDHAFDSQNNLIKDLNTSTAVYEKRMADIALGTGFTTQQTIEFSNSLGKIPGFIGSMTVAGEKSEDQLDGTTTALRLMSATGQTSAEITEEMTTAWEKLGNSQGKVADATQKGTEFIATMSEVMQSSNLRFADAKNFLESVSDQFKFTGDNTAAAAKVMDQFSQALQNTGLTAKSSSEIVSGMIKNISDLTLGTKAFISLRSGGPGGLQGALQIEQLMSQGKLDEVMNMMQKGLRGQLGGRIYTRAEGAESADAAAQFTRQRMLVQSGAFGIGKGTTDDQAAKILEALKDNNVGVLQETIKTGQAALKDVGDKGKQLQERNNTVFNRMSNAVERAAIAGELQLAATLRNTFRGKPGSERESEMNKIMGDALQLSKESASKFGLNTESMDKKSVNDLFNAPEVLAGMKDKASSYFKELVGFGKSGATDIAGNYKTTTDRQQRIPIEASLAVQREQRNQAGQKVKLDINLTAPDGFGVHAKSPDASVGDVHHSNAQRHNGGVPPHS